MSRNRYYLTIAELGQARGSDAALSWAGSDPASLAAALQDALRSPQLFQRWRARQAEPDEIDPALGAIDPQARVHACVVDLHTAVEADTDLPMGLLRQRLNWLIGAHWQLHDVRPA